MNYDTSSKHQDGLRRIHEEIDKLDQKLIKLLNSRMKIAASLASHKEKHELSFFDLSREEEIIQRAEKLAEHPVLKDHIQDLFHIILKSSRACAFFQTGYCRNIFLCGMPFSGKTHFGQLLAKKLQWKFFDSDRVVEEQYKKRFGKQQSCRQIFSLEGQERFRRYEREALFSIEPSEHSFIALGGGTLLCPQNRERVKKMGLLIYLKTPIRLLLSRLSEPLPAYLDPQNPLGSFEKMAIERCEIFENAADIIIDFESTSEERAIKVICKKILETRETNDESASLKKPKAEAFVQAT